MFSNCRHSAHEFLSFAFQRNGGEFSYNNHFAVIYKGLLIGIGSIFNAKMVKTFLFYDAINICKFYKIRSLSIIVRGLKIGNKIKAPKKNEISIAHLGIDKNYQSLGIGTKLILFLMTQCSNVDNGSYVLDVSLENPKAKSLYEKIGFKVSHTVPSKLKTKYGRVPAHFRMHFLAS